MCQIIEYLLNFLKPLEKILIKVYNNIVNLYDT